MIKNNYSNTYIYSLDINKVNDSDNSDNCNNCNTGNELKIIPLIILFLFSGWSVRTAVQ